MVRTTCSAQARTASSTTTPTTGSEQPILQPRTDKFYLPSLTLDYDFESVAFKSITAYQSAHIEGVNSNGDARTGAPAQAGVVVYPANELYPLPQAWNLPMQANACGNSKRFCAAVASDHGRFGHSSQRAESTQASS